MQTAITFRSWKWALVVVILLTGIGAYADTTPSWIRASTFAGSGEDKGVAVKVDKWGNQCVVGYFSSKATFNNKVLVSSGDADVFVGKFGPSGELLWLVQAGGSGDDQANDVAFDAAGSIYVTGWFTDRATFGSVDGKTQIKTGSGSTIFLAKYSASGNLLWVRTGRQTEGLGNGFGIAVEPTTGSVYITGRSQGTTSFSSADGKVYYVPGPGTWHMVLVKYDTHGQFQWGEWNSAAPNTVTHEVAVDAHDNPYVTGWFEGSTTFSSHDGHAQTINGLSQPVQSAPDYPDDTFVVKYDANGNLQWINDIGGYKAIGTDIAISPDGHITVTGFIGNINGDSVQSETIVTSQPPGSNISLGGGQFTDPYNRDVFVATYNSDGVATNAIRIGGTGQDGGSGVTYDNQGNLYLTGVFQGTMDVGGHTLNGTKTSNTFVLKYTSGSLAWAKQADGAGTQAFEENPRVSVGPAGKVFVTGGYQGTATFDNITLHSAGADDIFLMGLSLAHDTYFIIETSANPALLHQPVTFTTTSIAHDKSLGPVTGTVTFKADATTLGTVPISGSHASITTSSLAIGSHLIRAYYSGSDVFGANTASLTQVITEVALSASRLDFGDQAVGTTSPPQSVTITNVGSTMLSIASLSATGNFSIQANTCGTGLAAGASCTVAILFHPADTGNRYGHLWIYDNGGGSPQNVSLVGVGI